MNKARVIALAVAVVVFLIIIFQNTQDATVTLLLVRLTSPLALLLAIIFAGGFACGLLAGALMLRARARPA